MKTMALLTLLLIMSGSAVGQILKSNVTGFVGKDVLLSFNCSNDPKDLIWQKDDIIVNVYPQDKSIINDSYMDRTQLYIHKEKRNCSLLLQNISTADAGIYTSHAMNSVDNNIWSKKSTEVNLSVESGPKTIPYAGENIEVSAVSVSVPIALVVLILAVILLVILWIRRQHRTNTDTDSAAEESMLQKV